MHSHICVRYYTSCAMLMHLGTPNTEIIKKCIYGATSVLRGRMERKCNKNERKWNKTTRKQHGMKKKWLLTCTVSVLFIYYYIIICTFLSV